MSDMTLQHAIDHVQVVVTSSHLHGWKANREAWAIITAHLTQPAQAVDVGAKRLQARADEIESAILCGEMDVYQVFTQMRQLLPRALSGEKAGPVGDGLLLEAQRRAEKVVGATGVRFELGFPAMDGHGSLIDYLRATLHASPAPDKEGWVLGNDIKTPAAKVIRNEANQVYVEWANGKCVADYAGFDLYARPSKTGEH